MNRPARALVPVIMMIASLAFTGGVSLNPGNTDGSSTKVLMVSDLHWGVVVGGREYGVQRLKKIITWSNANGIDAWVVSGDWASMPSGIPTDATALLRRDSIVVHLTDTLSCPVYPVVGNHEYTAADTGDGSLYNNFTDRFPAFFNKFTDSNNRGSRWWGRRIGNSNVVIFAFWNIRGSPAGDYNENNPANGDGLAIDDFDGISDSTSAQRQDLRLFIENHVRFGDWVIAAQHRAMHGLASISTRPDQEGAEVDADSSQVKWLDDNLGRNYVLLEADLHETKLLDLHGKHYTFSATGEPRGIDAAKLSTWSSEVKLFSMSDTSWSGLTGSTLVDSLGVDSELFGAEESGLFWVIEFIQRSATARLYLVQYPDTDPVTLLDTFTFRQ